MDNDADIDGSDVKTYFAYDERWRVVGTYASPTAAGPTERWVHHAAGLAGTGGSSSIDSVVLRDRDVVLSGTGSSYGGDALEERVYVLQNWRADVVATLGRTGTLIEWIQYTPYGMAVTNPPGNADFNGDGGVDGADTEAFFLAWEGGLPSADINNDGAVDIADIAAFDDIWEAGETPQAGLCMLTAIRVGYAGYQWDGSVNNDRTVSGTMAGLYHVRHRVYDPELGRWTRRDPIGYVDGRNLQEYVGGRALARIDDSGLRSVSGAAVGAVGSIFINPSEPSDCPIGYHLDPRRNQCVRDVGFQDGLPIARVCCRRIRVNYAPTWMVHCEIVSSPPFYSCEEWASPDPVERQYPTRRSSAGQLPDGTPCSQASSSAIWNCLRVNPHSDGHVRPDSNCQTSVIDRQNKCCITSGFYRNWYAHPTAYVPPACTGRLFWRWLLDLD